MLSGCMVWQGYRDADGYGTLKDEDGKTRRAHRYMWTKFVGPIPKGYVLDHMLAARPVSSGPCTHGPACMNPAHMQAVPVEVNAALVRNWHRAKTHCPQGHRYDTLFDGDDVVELGHAVVYYCADGRIRRFCSACDKARKSARRKPVRPTV